MITPQVPISFYYFPLSDIYLRCICIYFFVCCNSKEVCQYEVAFVPRALPHLYLCSIPIFGCHRAKSGKGGLVLHRCGRPRAVFQVQRDGRGLAGRRLSDRETQTALSLLLLHPEPPVYSQPALLLSLRLLPAPYCPSHTGKMKGSFLKKRETV